MYRSRWKKEGFVQKTGLSALRVFEAASAQEGVGYMHKHEQHYPTRLSELIKNDTTRAAIYI